MSMTGPSRAISYCCSRLASILHEEKNQGRNHDRWRVQVCEQAFWGDTTGKLKRAWVDRSRKETLRGKGTQSIFRTPSFPDHLVHPIVFASWDEKQLLHSRIYISYQSGHTVKYTWWWHINKIFARNMLGLTISSLNHSQCLDLCCPQSQCGECKRLPPLHCSINKIMNIGFCFNLK